MAIVASGYWGRLAWLAREEKLFQGYLDSPAPLLTRTEVTVVAGSSLLQAVTSLADAGVVQAVPFKEAVIRLGHERKVQAGHYRFEPRISNGAIIKMLVEGDVSTEKFRLVEGTTFSMVLANLAAAGNLVNTLAGLPEEEAWAMLFPNSEMGPEGMLFPDTYLYFTGTTDVAILTNAHKQMQELLAELWATRASGLPLENPYEAMILASIIEKETGLSGERGLVASVFINRLRKGMRLQSDPTVIYGMKDRFDGNLSKKDLQRDTPYNTYIRGGLPPTPIAMVSKKSLQATLHPEESGFFYFVADGSGGHKFSKTLREHNNAVNRYQRGEKK